MIRITFLILNLIPLICNSQVVDFENLENLNPGDPVGEITLEESDYSIQFYIGHDLNDTVPLRMQKVAYDSKTGGFYGPESKHDCNGKKIETKRINQINDKKFVLNPEISNRERVGCHFVSGILLGEKLPSIFIFYNKAVTGCSADLLDLDGHDNTIEAYDIYCYANTSDYPSKPINDKPVEIRSIGSTFGPGILGDNGGVMPFSIDFTTGFTLIEIRPIQQVSGGNDVRHEFGFALDNYSPRSVEQAPYIPPYLSGEENKVAVANVNDKKLSIAPIIQPEIETAPVDHKFIERNESIYFDFDSAILSTAAIEILDDIIDDINALNASERKMEIMVDLSGFTDPVGSSEYNLHLSQKRANATAAYFLKHGVNSTLLKKTSHGESYLGDSNDSDGKKRTVQIKLSYRKV